MKAHPLTTAAFVFLLGAGIPAIAHAGSGTSAGCVDWRSEAVFNGSGYNHLVHLASRCDKRMTCEVSSDVNPALTEVVLAPGKSQVVNTFLGSPSSEFTPKVVCRQK
jgi:hypothetical protein